MNKSKNMIRLFNHWAYGGLAGIEPALGRPKGITPARWSGIVKFFEKNRKLFH
jgi:hypothetical protein